MQFMRSYLLFFLFFVIPSFAMEPSLQSPIQVKGESLVDFFNRSVANKNTQNESLPRGYNALHVAAMLGQTDKAHAIIHAKKCDINQRDNVKGQTPLLLACGQGHKRMVYILLSAGANPNIADKDGDTPLIMAVDDNNSTIADLLLFYGAQIDQLDIGNDNTPLHTAIVNYNSDMVEFLLARNASPNLALGHDFTPLMAAAQLKTNSKRKKTHCLRIIKALLDKGADHAVAYRKDKDTALHCVVHRLNQDGTYILLAAGANPNACNAEGYTPLSGVLKKNIRTITKKNHTEVKRACRIAQLLLLYGGTLSKQQLKDKNINPDVLLAVGVVTGTSHLVKFSLESGANPNYKYANGDTPLHSLAKRKLNTSTYNIAFLLLGYGADFTPVDMEKNTVRDVYLESMFTHDNLNK